jgi:hypothetical protein
MTTPQPVQNLVAQILRDFPAAQLEFDPYPSGACVLNVALEGRQFELEYSPQRGAGVSENFADTPPFIGQDEAFDSLEAAAERLLEFLASAARGETKESPFAAMALHDKPN